MPDGPREPDWLDVPDGPREPDWLDVPTVPDVLEVTPGLGLLDGPTILDVVVPPGGTTVNPVVTFAAVVLFAVIVELVKRVGIVYPVVVLVGKVIPVVMFGKTVELRKLVGPVKLVLVGKPVPDVMFGKGVVGEIKLVDPVKLIELVFVGKGAVPDVMFAKDEVLEFT